jgi:imidazoleglycerol phosphate synthase glutamine amidotransferase subunit HisH
MITIIDYQMGNLHSVKRAFNRLRVDVRITTNPVADISLVDSIRARQSNSTT